MLVTETVNRVVDKELLVQTVNGDVVTVRVDRDETLASFKKRLQNVLTFPLEKSHLEFGSVKIPLGDFDLGDVDSSSLMSPQLHASGRLRDFPNGVPVLLKREPRSHRRSLSSPNLSLSNDNEFINSLRNMEEADRSANASTLEGEFNHLGLSNNSDQCSSSGSPDSEASCSPKQHGVLYYNGVKPSLKFVGNYGNRAKSNKMSQDIARGFRTEEGDPERLTEGLGGAYVFKNAVGKKIAVVKPTDEEPLAPNNPKGFVGRSLGDPGLKPTVRVGEAGLREAAAYLLDHDNFSKVPFTSLARMTHGIFNYNQSNPSVIVPSQEQNTKLVSVQEFVEHQYDASDVGTAMFPVGAVHKIGILDIRLFNTDRHSGNILVCNKEAKLNFNTNNNSRGGGLSGSLAGSAGSLDRSSGRFSFPTVDLVPIDHGFCLPETLETVYFEWLHWPQASMPFSEEELAYIAKLDPKGDISMLYRELPMLRVQSLRILEVSTTLLKKSAERGLTLAEIGAVMSAPISGFSDELASELERLCILAKEEVTFSYSMNSMRFSMKQHQEDWASDEMDSDMEDSMFEMDDILSPQVSHASSSKASSFKSDSPKQDFPGGGSGGNFSNDQGQAHPREAMKLKTFSTFKALQGAMDDGSGSSTPRSPRIAICRRHSSINGADTSPFYPTAASVAHGGHAMMQHRYNANKNGMGGPVVSKPINCDMPSSEMMDLFGNMNGEMWSLFCKVLFAEIDRALDQGVWKHVSSEGNNPMHYGSSCPDF
jgi:hypothetical protein